MPAPRLCEVVSTEEVSLERDYVDWLFKVPRRLSSLTLCLLLRNKTSSFPSELNALDMNTMISDVQSWIDAHSIPQESALDDLYIDVQNNSTPQESIPGDLYSNVLILDGFRMFALR